MNIPEFEYVQLWKMRLLRKRLVYKVDSLDLISFLSLLPLIDHSFFRNRQVQLIFLQLKCTTHSLAECWESRNWFAAKKSQNKYRMKEGENRGRLFCQPDKDSRSKSFVSKWKLFGHDVCIASEVGSSEVGWGRVEKGGQRGQEVLSAPQPHTHTHTHTHTHIQTHGHTDKRKKCNTFCCSSLSMCLWVH